MRCKCFCQLMRSQQHNAAAQGQLLLANAELLSRTDPKWFWLCTDAVLHMAVSFCTTITQLISYTTLVAAPCLPKTIP